MAAKTSHYIHFQKADHRCENSYDDRARVVNAMGTNPVRELELMTKTKTTTTKRMMMMTTWLQLSLDLSEVIVTMIWTKMIVFVTI